MKTMLGESRHWMVRGGRTERLAMELQRLVDADRPGARLVELLRMPRRCRSSWAIEDLELHLDDGSSLSLVWKDLDREGPGSRALSVKPRRLRDARRELWVYDRILSRMPGGSPFRGCVSDDPSGVHWLFLDPVEGPPLCEVGDRSVWEAAATWLARFHATFLDSPPSSRLLLRQSARLHRWWYRRALSLAGEGNGRRSALLRDLGTQHRMAVDQVLGGPVTLLHGEFYPANVLVARPRERIVPVDWEMAALGPPVLDLAALTSGAWTGKDRAQFARAYRQALLDAGAPCPGLDTLLGHLEAARLLLAVQWLGWAGERWRPPSELRTDWLMEAIRSADRLTA